MIEGNWSSDGVIEGGIDVGGDNWGIDICVSGVGTGCAGLHSYIPFGIVGSLTGGSLLSGDGASSSITFELVNGRVFVGARCMLSCSIMCGTGDCNWGKRVRFSTLGSNLKYLFLLSRVA